MSDSTGLTAEEVADLMPGDNVLVHGLVSRPALNGRLGMVTGTFEAASGRLPVQVEHEPSSVRCVVAGGCWRTVGCINFGGACWLSAACLRC